MRLKVSSAKWCQFGSASMCYNGHKRSEMALWCSIYWCKQRTSFLNKLFVIHIMAIYRLFFWQFSHVKYWLRSCMYILFAYQHKGYMCLHKNPKWFLCKGYIRNTEPQCLHSNTWGYVCAEETEMVVIQELYTKYRVTVIYNKYWLE